MAAACSRRVLAAGCALLVAVGGLAACSSSGSTTGSSSGAPVPALTPETAATQTSQSSQPATTPSSPASEGASPQEVTAESLSSPRDEYEVTAIPEGLSADESQVVAAYVAYDHTAWLAYRSLDQTQADSVADYASGQALADFTSSFADRQAQGKSVGGTGLVSFTDVTVVPDSTQANVSMCVDLTGATLVSDSGAPAPEDFQRRYSSQATLQRLGNTWIVILDETTGTDNC